MCLVLAKKFSLECHTRINKDKKKVIVINHESYDRLLTLTLEYIIPAMQYQ